MTPEDAARRTGCHDEPDDPDFDSGRGLSVGAWISLAIWFAVGLFLALCVRGVGL